MKVKNEGVKVRGFFRLQMVDHETQRPVSKMTPWMKNQVVNLGFQDYVCAAVGGVAGSKQITHLAIGTGTAPGAAATSLDGETGVRASATNSVVSSKTLQCTGQFAGSDMAGTCTIQNIALANTSSGGTICCGNTYTTSQWQSNQDINSSYQLRYS